MMAVDGRSTRGRPRDVVKVVTRRVRALRSELIEGILTRRARGLKTDRIARELQLDVARVETALAERRRLGDPRALTDHQIVGLAATVARRERAKAPPEMPPAPALPPEPAPGPAVAPAAPRVLPRVVRGATFAPGLEGRRAPYLAMLRDAADRVFPSHEHAAACFGHLFDLFVHHDTFYPTYVMRDGGGHATVESTDRMFPRHPVARSLTSSHGALCLAG